MSSNLETIDKETLDYVSRMDVFDSSGNKVKFGSIFERQKTVVVFIRMRLLDSQCLISQLNKLHVRPLLLRGMSIHALLSTAAPRLTAVCAVELPSATCVLVSFPRRSHACPYSQ